MTLQEKLKAKGYQPYGEYDIVWLKKYNKQFTLRIILVNEENIFDAMVEQNWFVRKQSEINDLQIAFNNLTRDLKELRQ